LTSSDLFTPIFVPDAVRDAVSGRAWVQAMLDAEAALAAAEARAGVIPSAAAEAIAACCDASGFDVEALAREARDSGNPVVPLVRALTERVEGSASGYVHWGATSQDVLDTAAMLVARRALEPIGAELDAVAAICATLADGHRTTLMAGRTLMQQALPTSFGLKAAGWLLALVRARRRLGALRLPVELGGAAGTLASLGERGLAVLRAMAEELDLAEPKLPWHSDRTAVAELGTALALTAGALEKVALDVVLMAQTEVGELAEASGDGRGGSSTMPHKQNPVGSTRARACAPRVRAAAGLLLEAMAGEHERAAGAWHSEWGALGDALAFTGGAAAAVHEALEGLEVHPDRMRENLERTAGLLLTERVTMTLAERIGRSEAKRIVEGAVAGSGSLRERLLATDQLSEEEVDRALDPGGYLGSADAFIGRALEAYRSG
jgi:3-carboxy-cis,cis-muconate cycloisomerase